MTKTLLWAACITALCACTKAETPDLQTDNPETKSGTEYLDITIRFSSWNDGYHNSYQTNPMLGVDFTQAWAKAEVPGQINAPHINRISFTIKDVYPAGNYNQGTIDFPVSIDFPDPSGAYSEQMPFCPCLSSYIDINLLSIDPSSLKNDYTIRGHCDNFEIKSPPSYPYPDPDPDPDPDPFDSLLLHSPRL